MHVFGITGGVGAGKSTVLELLERNFGAAVIQADEVGRMLMEPGYKGYEQTVAVFGDGVLMPGEGNPDARPIDRKKLADIVFADRNKRTVLNGIIHPLVKKYITEEIGRVLCAGGHEFMFIEAALLIEDHYDVICDELWYIYADEDVRRERLANSRGYSEDKTDNILKSQLSDEEFRAHCSRVIDNSGSEAETLRQLKEIISEYG